MGRSFRLKVVGDESEEREVSLSSDSAFVIGRSAECDLLIDNRTVSRRHCRFFLREDRLYVEDLDSKKGTLLNGEPVGLELIEGNSNLMLGDVQVELKVAGSSTSQRQKSPAPKPSEPEPGDDDLAREVTVVGNTGRKGTRQSLVIPVGEEEIILGRDPELAQVAIADLNISRQHCRVFSEDDRVYVEDLGSSNGTFVNGTEIRRRRPLTSGDTLSLGGQHLLFDGEVLRSVSNDTGLGISALNLGVANSRPGPGQPDWILKSITFTVRSGEFVGLLGTSGAGKSTLLRALSGRSRTPHGEILYDAERLYERFEAFRSSIGYAPQKDIFHEDLTLAEALRFASQLKLPADISAQEMEQNIDRVIELVELTERKNTVIRNLSGGQKRRVSIAVELLGDPRVLYLDEVTSGLDPYLEEQMMKLFRRLSSDNGITIFIITHHANSAEMCDKVIYLNKGQLTFFGLPDETKQFFGVETFEQVYKIEGSKTPDDWREEFESSQQYETYIEDEAYHQTANPPRAEPIQEKADSSSWAYLWRQCSILTRRNVKVFVADRMNMLVLALGPVVAYLLCVLTRSDQVTDVASFVGKQFKLCVGSTLVMYFLGIFSSVREIVKELDIYLHEHFATVEIIPYVLSKVLPLALLGLVQTSAVVWILTQYGGMSLKDPRHVLIGVLFLTYLTAMLAGLAISAAVRTSDLAIMVMLFFVIPQVLFGGGLSGAKGPSGDAEFIARNFISDYWSLEATKALIADYQGTSVGSILTSKGLSKSCWMLGAHGGVFLLATVLLMIRKDGAGAKSSANRVLAAFTGGRPKGTMG